MFYALEDCGEVTVARDEIAAGDSESSWLTQVIPIRRQIAPLHIPEQIVEEKDSNSDHHEQEDNLSHDAQHAHVPPPGRFHGSRNQRFAHR